MKTFKVVFENTYLDNNMQQCQDFMEFLVVHKNKKLAVLEARKLAISHSPKVEYLLHSVEEV